ncbi:SWPV2-ORF106 [Shearwaterpox virus]|uniref:SWPV2-ORF106 n=1 Tax=Shearwaterpox virus TaxID=1974596 RepID=A0A1V0QG73_CNPV|nr:SWPV2-ORF106 [Shearwaterpox virus]QRM15386.1 DNA-binding protein [Mudlarkpox virus]QRM15744.1 DNA-binding protein [Penguinpox virus 2]QRM16076.1 DNA-binding protein [Albatrosspox virus]
MDNFIKQISSKIVKPIAELEPPDSKVQYYYMTISFNFPDLYYCNKNLFAKPDNTLLDVSKSLLTLNSFPYENFVINDLLRTIRRYCHVYDVYFLPVGWFVGKEDVLPNYQVSIKIIRSTNQEVIENIIRNYLSRHDIYGDNLSIETDRLNGVSINRHSIVGARQLAPICVVSFYPFDPENKILFVIYVGRYKDRHCGVSYVVDREDMYKVINRIYSYVVCIYLVSDDMVTFHTTPLANHSKKLIPLPINHCNTLCEIVHDFEFLRFEQSTMPIPVFTPFIPKQLVNIINLPDDIPITCASINRLEYVTHIDDKKLKRVLIIVKDKFLRNTILHGTFKKRNIVRNRKYTFTITWSNFECPTLGDVKSSSPNTCNRVVLDGSRYVTKTFNDTI